MDVTVTVELGSPLFTNSPTGGIQEMTADFVLVDETMTMADPVLLQTYVANAGQQTYTNDALSKTFNIKTTLTGRTEQKLALGLSMRNRNFYEDNIGVHRYFNNPSSIKVTVKEGSYIRMTLMSKTTTKDIYAETILVHNALNHIVECISENQLQCKSNFYKTPNSYDASGGVSCGNGGLKAITNGYKIRGLCSDGETERNMPLSFKDMVEAMDTQDCIGWGFVEENGKLVGSTYSLTTTTENDDRAYNDAMNKYHYEKAKYEHEVQAINSKLEVVHGQDKDLELRLKQLETEQNAISSEIESVKKVISKNVDGSFKTFNA
jgi:hypothetical protein